MTTIQRSATALFGIALVGAYSWTMMSTGGSAASWAWLMLVAAFVAVGAAARRSIGGRED